MRLFAALLVILSVPLHAADWQPFQAGEDDSILSIDKDSILSDGDVVKVWIKISYYGQSKNQQLDKRVVESRNLMRFNCRERQFRHEYIILYDDRNEIIGSKIVSESFKPIVPDSLGEVEMNYACRLAADTAKQG